MADRPSRAAYFCGLPEASDLCVSCMGSNARAGKTRIQLFPANSHWRVGYLQKIGRGRVETWILCGAQDGALRHVVEACPFLEMARGEKVSSEEMNSARGGSSLRGRGKSLQPIMARIGNPSSFSHTSGEQGDGVTKTGVNGRDMNGCNRVRTDATEWMMERSGVDEGMEATERTQWRECGRS